MISTTAIRATRTPMTAPSAVLLILVVLSFCEVVVGDILSMVTVVEVLVVGSDCAVFNTVSYNACIQSSKMILFHVTAKDSVYLLADT